VKIEETISNGYGSVFFSEWVCFVDDLKNTILLVHKEKKYT